MKHYMILAMVLHFSVNCVLNLATVKLTNGSICLPRVLLGASVGSVYAAACTAQQFYFLNSPLWYGINLCVISMISFGINEGAFYKALLFSLVRISFDANGKNGAYYLIYILTASTALLLILWTRSEKSLLIPIELHYCQKAVKLMALKDTGNMLHDPISGKPVLIVGADVAAELTGLTEKQLNTPVDTVGAIPGLRLIPYKTIGERGKMLLAISVQNAIIDGRSENSVVAFAPMLLDEKGKYQALIGGI